MAITINGTKTTFSDTTTQVSYLNMVDTSTSATQNNYKLGHMILASNVLYPDKWGTYDFGYTWTYTSVSLNQSQVYRRTGALFNYNGFNGGGEPYFLWVATNSDQVNIATASYTSSTSITLNTPSGTFAPTGIISGDYVNYSGSSISKFNGLYIISSIVTNANNSTIILTTVGTANTTTFVIGDSATNGLITGNLANQAYAWTTTRYFASSSTKPGLAMTGTWVSRGMTCDVGIDDKFLNVTLFQRIA